MSARLILALVLAVTLSSAADLRTEALKTLRKAANFYRQEVSNAGGYHFHYAADLSYGRSEFAEGPTQVSVQREGTPSVGMAFLEAWEATGDHLYLDAATDAAHALVQGQLCSGGWTSIIEFAPARRPSHAYRVDNNCAGTGNTTVLDDNRTQAAVRLLMRVDRELEFQDQAIHDAATFALEKLIAAQYPNGAWPQRFAAPPDPAKYPVKQASYPESWERQWPGAGFYDHYTFNDNTISDVIDMFLEAARIYDAPEYLAAAERGGGFILLAQMPDPQPAWAQQYDVRMQPAWARLFEPPAVTGGESQGILRTLLVLYQETGNRKYLEAVPRALQYLQASVLPESDSEVYRRAARGGGPVLARFYELKTNRPLYITKGMQIRVRGRSTEHPDGYELSYSDQSVIKHYGVLVSGRELAGIAAEYRRLAAANPASIRRPAKLHGLSPWQSPDGPIVTDSAVRAIIDAIDTRGAWVEEGYIGKADRVVSVSAAASMTVRIGERTYPLKENETVEVFAGALPPREQVIHSQTFVHNLTALARFVALEGGHPDIP